jgi:hypothetical protein
MAGSSFVSAQTKATIQPIAVHPRKKFNAAMALMFRLFLPTMVGRKYSATRTKKIKMPAPEKSPDESTNPKED